MKILYLGDDHGTSRHRADALRRIGHDVHVVDPATTLPGGARVKQLVKETGGLVTQEFVARRILDRIEGSQYDLTWVNGGHLVGAGLVRTLRRFGPVVNYNNDDPLGGRDRRVWTAYKRAIPEYDLHIVMRALNVPEMHAAGAKSVLRVFMSADEAVHAPREATVPDTERWSADVLFVGTWMEDRGAFMAELIRRGVPLTIRGARWDHAPEWPRIKSAWKGPGLSDPSEYTLAIQCSKVSLGLLSKGNRDRHTQRSMEIPYAGGVLCAERTDEHKELYDEGHEALFWSDADECARVCHQLLESPELRIAISRAGRLRCIANGHLNERVVSRAVGEAIKIRSGADRIAVAT